MEDSTLSVLAILFMVVIIGVTVLLIASFWQLFTKAGKPGWAAIVPIYNLIVLCEIVRKPWYWVLLMLIPYVGLIWSIWAINLLVKKFGKDEGFTIGCILLPYVFFPILAFGNNRYLGQPDIVDGESGVLDSDFVR